MQNKPIDIFLLSWNRSQLTRNTVRYLHERTKYPFRIIVIDNNSDEETVKMLSEMEEGGLIHHCIRHSKNVGVHQGWNTAMGMADGDYFITTDNDIYVPQLDPDWLTQMVKLMDENENLAALALQPHVFVGDNLPLPHSSGVIEKSHCGAVMRMMRSDAVRKVNGWDKHYDANRNHEELTVCSRLRDAGYRVGYTSYMKAYHDFGTDKNWGYGEVHPHVHGHRIPGGSKFAEGGPGEIWIPKMINDDRDSYDTRTWEEIKK